MHCLVAALLLAASPSYVLFSRGQRVDLGQKVIHQPSGVRLLSARKDGLVRADIVHEERFQAWLVRESLSAVIDEGEQQAMPVVLARGDRTALARYGAVRETQNPGVFAVALGAGVIDPRAMAQRMARDARVQWAEPDVWGQFETRAFNDTLYPNQWHLHPSLMQDVAPDVDIGADQAWLYTKGIGTAGRVVLAVLDDGFSMSHPDMVDQYIPDGAGGYVGKDFVDGDNDPSAQSGDGHGTRVLGAAAARGNNGIGVAGVCPECYALPVRLFTSNGKSFNPTALYGPMSVAADAMLWAADHGARVINNSWGPLISQVTPTYQAMPQIVYDAITNIVTREGGKKGVLVTWAAGNNGQTQSVGFDGWVSDGRVIAVGAMNATGELANYSEVGPAVRLLAPSSEQGSDLPAIYTTDGAMSYSSTFGGTSAAAPIVAGAAALLFAKHPELTLAQAFEVLFDSARKVDSANANYGRKGKSCSHGYGEIDALHAIEIADARTLTYQNGLTLAFELCGDGIDNDGNPQTSDTCPVCVPTSARETDNDIDDDCDGYIDNTIACQPLGLKRCDVCNEDADCAQDFVCLDRGGDGKRCLRTCDIEVPCAFEESCIAGACLPQKGGAAVECGPFLTCLPTNGGVEKCDKVDNDCNGQIDEIAPTSQEALRQTAAFRRASFGVCAAQIAQCKGGRWVASRSTERVEEEVDLCDDLDNDCDGVVDEGCPKKEEPASMPTGACQGHDASPPYWLLFFFFLRRRHDRQRR